MKICTKIARLSGMLFGSIAIILVLFGVIGFLMWTINGSALFNVANFWNYLMASVPFSLLAICCTLFMISDKDKA